MAVLLASGKAKACLSRVSVLGFESQAVSVHIWRQIYVSPHHFAHFTLLTYMGRE